MKLVLKDFQEEAVESLYERVSHARTRAALGRLEVVTLAAPTGSGKTVILTRLIELIMQGDETRNPDPDAVFLWITDQPELNIQTRDKMEATSDFLSSSVLVEIAADFDYESFSPGNVYFLNTQKLGAGTNFVRTGDSRSFTLWDTVRNTAQSTPDRFFVIIDEAHRGTKLDTGKADEANSIMQKFVLGSDELPPIPLVLGISATLDRFTDLLEAAARARKSRTHHRVDIHPADVIGSGLLKSKVILHNPKQTLGAEYPLLRDAARSWGDMEQRWRSYCTQQGEPQIVQPILLVQVEDGNKSKTSNTDLEAVIAAIRDEVGGLPNSAFSHAFQEGTDVYLPGGVSIRYIAPSAINGDPNVKVVLFKSSLNTGWDCPRAEVMMSFRHAKDATLIAQLVGRMVRAPLARRIDYDDVLNSVSLMLPNFDDAQLSRVIAYITSDPDNIVPTEVERSTSRVILTRAAELEPCIKALTGIPSYIIPRQKSTRQVMRLGLLADALSHSELRTGASSEARDDLAALLEALYNEKRETLTYSEIVKEHGTIPVSAVVLDYAFETITGQGLRQVPISGEMVSELYEWARKRLGLDLGLRYWKRRVDADRNLSHTIVKLELYALASDPSVIEGLESHSYHRVADWLGQYKQEINALSEAERSHFDEVKQQTNRPLLDGLDFEGRLTLDWSIPSGYTAWDRHLYQDQNGRLPERLNSWEAATLKEEMARPDFVGWLRNRDRQPWALRIPYELGGSWKSCYPDFLVFRRRGTHVIVDIVDPHLTSIEDAPQKAAALAKYTDQHQDRFGRVDLVVVEGQEPNQEVQRLDLINDNIRTKVAGVTTNQHLKDLFELAG